MIPAEVRARYAAAARRVAAQAPVIQRGDPVALALKRAYAGFPEWVATHQDEWQQTADEAA